MWLLSTGTALLHYFVSPESVSDGYAILSHVWGATEQTFQEVQALRNGCIPPSCNPRDYVSPKIRQCCILAESRGYKWVWIDTCCIDKTSSTELSEAINSMFRYYALADVCFAYLQDVPDAVSEEGQVTEAFSSSRWHTRGWTLQELLAPNLVVFLSQGWNVIGSKAELASLLEECTGIPQAVLRLEQQLTDISIARRMSWAAPRQTTRLEDEAYCLMGVFGINMPTLYGEGSHAFRRLLEEILKQSTDTTLFAWGDCLSNPTLVPPAPVSRLAGADMHTKDSYLFPPGPSAFSGCSDIEYTPPIGKRRKRTSVSSIAASTGLSLPFQITGIPTFSITPHGVLSRIPIIETQGYTIALLFWTRAGQHLGLILYPCQYSADPVRPLYDIGLDEHRLVLLGPADGPPLLCEEPLLHTWREVFLRHRPAPDAVATRMKHVVTNLGLRPPFRFPERHIADLLKHEFAFVEWTNGLPHDWSGSPPMEFTFAFPLDGITGSGKDFIIPAGPKLRLRLGRCGDPEHSVTRPHWANVTFSWDWMEQATHVCDEDHIDAWPRRSRTFIPEHPIDGVKPVVLSFTPCGLNPTSTLVVHLSFPS